MRTTYCKGVVNVSLGNEFTPLLHYGRGHYFPPGVHHGARTLAVVVPTADRRPPEVRPAPALGSGRRHARCGAARPPRPLGPTGCGPGSGQSSSSTPPASHACENNDLRTPLQNVEELGNQGNFRGFRGVGIWVRRLRAHGFGPRRHSTARGRRTAGSAARSGKAPKAHPGLGRGASSDFDEGPQDRPPRRARVSSPGAANRPEFDTANSFTIADLTANRGQTGGNRRT
jgi:hypothetical protein